MIISLGEGASGVLSGIFVILACISWGIDNHLTAVIDGITPQTTTFIKGLIGGTVNLTIGMVLSEGNIQFSNLVVALLIGVFSYGISIYLYVTSAQNLGGNPKPNSL